MIEWFLQGNWHDWKYPVTVILCTGTGYLIGHTRCKEKIEEAKRKEDLRLAITNHGYS